MRSVLSAREERFGMITLTRVSLPARENSRRSAPLPSSPVTSTSARAQPVTTTEPAMFEIST